MQTKTHYYTANAFEILGFTTTDAQTHYYPIENHEPAVGMVGPVPAATLLARLLDDVAVEGWTPVRSGGWTPLTREETIALCQTDTATLFFQRYVDGPAVYLGASPAAPSAEESQRRRQRGQEAALAIPEWPRSIAPGRSDGMSNSNTKPAWAPHPLDVLREKYHRAYDAHLKLYADPATRGTDAERAARASAHEAAVAWSDADPSRAAALKAAIFSDERIEDVVKDEYSMY